tara:strand:- start:6183 stop:7214 length:1032 start_codon:yes stop_codon:yes gene_type:complete
MNKLIASLIVFSLIYPLCPGDVNEDYTINIQDVIIIVNEIIDDVESNYLSDVNDDGDVDILDIITIINIILYNDEYLCLDPINITYNIHNSLPLEWIAEFYIIIENLSDLIPAYQNYYDELTVYAWNSNVEDPYPGIQGGTYIGGADEGFNMVLEINQMEFEWDHMHRYSVIAHEYFHVYQLSINEAMNQPNGGYNPNTFSIKWLIEGAATTFESMYIQNYYNYNYFLNDLIYTEIDESVYSNPNIFEDYSSNSVDINYTSSTFMVLVLAKELMNLGHSEEDAFKMIFEEFMLTGAKNSDWQNYFIATFGFSVNEFYDSIQTYPLNLENVIPSSSISLQQIFN